MFSGVRKRSAHTPAGNARQKTGIVMQVRTADTISGLGSIEVINHWAPVSCIHVPILDTSPAIQKLR